MTSLKLLALFLLCVSTAYAQDLTLHDFEAKKTSAGVEFLVRVKTEGQFPGKVRIPIEGVFIDGPGGTEISEKNLLGSGLDFDLNGDGDKEDVLPAAKTPKGFTASGLPLMGFVKANGAQDTKNAGVYHLDPKGTGFIVYSLGKSVQVGLDFGSQKAEFREFRNPFLQVGLIQDYTPDGPKLELVGAPYSLYSWEPINSDAHKWYRIQWMALKTNEKHSVRVRGKGQGRVFMAVNMTDAEGCRVRKFLVSNEPVKLGD